MQRNTKKTTDEFIQEAKTIHGNKYNYSKVNYVNAKTKVCIICPKHGEFWQTPSHHLSGQGCTKCNGKLKYTKENFIKKAKEIHRDKYDYSKIKYVNAHTAICIICPEHGEFWQLPCNHLKGCGCGLCANNITHSTEEFIELSKQKHNNKYDYSKVNYINSKTKVCIICPEHGEFWQTPSNHLCGQGCLICCQSELEDAVKKYLDLEKIDYIYQYKIDWIDKPDGHYQSLDFFLPKYNIGIECQGGQHFYPVNHFGGNNEYKNRKQRDKQKLSICEHNNIRIIYYTNIKLKKYPYDVIIDINKLKNKIFGY